MFVVRCLLSVECGRLFAVCCCALCVGIVCCLVVVCYRRCVRCVLRVVRCLVIVAWCVVRCSLVVVGWLLNGGIVSSAVRCTMLSAAGRSFCVVRWLLCVAGCCWLLRVDRCSLLVARCVLRVACLLYVVW